MRTQTKTGLVAAAITGFAVGYLTIRAKRDEHPRDSFRYRKDDAIRRAQARGMERDYREMERMYDIAIS